MPPKMFQARVANGALRFRYFLDEARPDRAKRGGGFGYVDLHIFI